MNVFFQNNAKADQFGVSRNSAMSDNIWNTLRMSITLMNRPELYKVVEARDLGELSRIFLKSWNLPNNLNVLNRIFLPTFPH